MSARSSTAERRGRAFTRKGFLKLGGAGLMGVALVGAGSSCGGAEEGGALTYAEGPDDTGTLRRLLDGFTGESGVRVRYREMPADATGYLTQLRTELQAGSSGIDVIAGDVIWPAELAENGFIADLSDRFTEDFRNRFLPGNVASNEYDGAFYGVPFVTGAGLLYYRRDLLEESGYDAPPETWEDLKQMAKKIRSDSGVRFGYVFQGGNYEGGVVNGMEYIWTHGGEVLDGERVVIDSPEAAAGLATYRSMISDGVTADAMTTYKEEEAQAAFLRGDAAFMRNWSYVYALISDPAQSEMEPAQVGVSALPTAGGPPSSALGATNLYINAASERQDAAFEFIRYVTAPDQQKMRAIDGARLPVLKTSYDDPEILEQVPVVALGEEALANARPRPVSPYYSDMSLRMADQFSRVLKGELPPDEAVGTLQRELEDVIEQGESSGA